MKQTVLFGLKVYNGSFVNLKKDLSRWLKGRLAQSKLKLIATPNPEQVVLASKNQEFLAVLNQFDVLIPDGVGLVWASRFFKARGLIETAVKERVTGVDLVSWLLEFAFEYNLKVLLVGGKDLGKLKIQNLKLKIEDDNDNQLVVHDVREMNLDKRDRLKNKQTVVYWTEAYKDKLKRTKKEEAELKNLISKLRPDIVLVAFGAPFQEMWLLEHRQLLERSGVKLGMVVGGALDMLVGRLPRAPYIMQQLGLEWFWRLVLEPSRIKRQLKLLKFIWLTLTYSKESKKR